MKIHWVKGCPEVLFFRPPAPYQGGGGATTTDMAGMKIRRRFGNYDYDKNENSAVVPFILLDYSDPDTLLPSQPDISGILRPPHNVGPQGPQGKGGGGDEYGDGRKGDGGLNRIRIRIERADIPTNEGVPR